MRSAKNPAERGFDPYDKRRLARALHGVQDARTYRRIQAVPGLRWKRPRYTYANKDPHRAQKKGALFAA
jgi:hypothetical protein